ncbi:hypothetical protein AHF37_03230 [Paragonimus kellicotti]|nr:hypothetical protein AHF37_03230 [Paragonimus kellicotti]
MQAIGVAKIYLENDQLNEAKDALDEAVKITGLDIETLYLAIQTGLHSACFYCKSHTLLTGFSKLYFDTCASDFSELLIFFMLLFVPWLFWAEKQGLLRKARIDLRKLMPLTRATWPAHLPTLGAEDGLPLRYWFLQQNETQNPDSLPSKGEAAYRFIEIWFLS